VIGRGRRPAANHSRSTSNASDRLLNGTSTGSPDGPICAHQQPSASGSSWLARQPKLGPVVLMVVSACNKAISVPFAKVSQLGKEA